MTLTIATGSRDADAAEGKSTDRPQVVLELARLGALDRPVAGVVHAGRHLVAEQAAFAWKSSIANTPT